MSIYIIGEIGQNHNGSVDIAKLLVDLVSRPVHEELFGLTLNSMDAIKLQKRDLSVELTDSAMNHSFGRTYGEHRAALELSNEQHFEIYKHVKTKGMDLIETICSIGAMSLLKIFTPDKLKVASRDLTNIPLISALAETKIPIILSTGMASNIELDDAIKTILRYHSNITILHCVSEYPTQPQNLNLNTIEFLKENYSEYSIGFSDHTIGIVAPIAAVAMGVSMIEKHITIDRRMKGTDQSGSLGPDGINRMIRDIRLMELGMGKKELFIDSSTDIARVKLERSIALKKEIKKGKVITEDDIHMLSPGDGFKWRDRKQLLGRKALKNILQNEIIYQGDIE